MATGLYAHILRKRAILADYQASGAPRARTRIAAATRVQDETGVRRISVRDYQLLSDSGPGLAGYDLGPSSPELFLSALSSCLCHVFLTQAGVRDVRLEAVASRAEATMLDGAGAFGDPAVPGYPHDIAYIVDVLSPEPDDALRALWAEVRAHCPVYLLVSRAVPVDGTLRRIAPGAEPAVLGTHRSGPPPGERG
jgi:uncharacterized OsmC-like protein